MARVSPAPFILLRAVRAKEAGEEVFLTVERDTGAKARDRCNIYGMTKEAAEKVRKADPLAD